MSVESRISVAVRIRPKLEKEKFDSLCAHKADDGETLILRNEDEMCEPLVFQFDDVYDGGDDQGVVYEQSVQDLVDHVLQGANSTVFTYGQTGSGKTYTILGAMSNGTLTEQSGMFPRVFHDLFAYREVVVKKMHLVIFLSAVELYVEDAMDLLAERKKIKIRDTPEETITPGVKTVEIHSMDDVILNFKRANVHRSIASTRMNESSSRSHAIFFIDVYQVPINVCPVCPTRQQLMDANNVPISNVINGLVRSRLALVDLAGSERVKRSGVEGQAMIEAQAINKSLSALGTTINAMYTGSTHIPFRESKLTKLLKPSFVDRTSRILLIGQISPSITSAQESQGTLRFCDRVKGLKAGKVGGFLDPEEELRYLQSLRQNEELAAELRIAGVKYFHQPQRAAVIAKLKGISVEESRNACIAALKRDAADIEARKEAEYIQEMEVRIAKDHKSEARKFVEKMNHMIDEYETLAQCVKREKKSAKLLAQEQQEEQDAKIAEAKKSKKRRLKLEENVQKLHAALREGEQTAKRVENTGQSCLDCLEEDVLGGGETLTEEESSKDQMVHLIVKSFFLHAKELAALHDSYVQRLATTQRKRREVRRTKLLSSDIILESTLVQDIIHFVIDRAVDILNGYVRPSDSYSWDAIDGLSNTLRNGDQWFPPLLTAIPGDVNVLNEEVHYHDSTFLGSDESCKENTATSRRVRGRPVTEKMHQRDNDKMDSDNENLEHNMVQELSTQREVNRLENSWCMEDYDYGSSSSSSFSHQSGQHSRRSGKQSSKARSAVADDGKDLDMDNGEDDNGEKAENVRMDGGDDAACNDNDLGKKKPKGEIRTWQDQEYLMRVYDSPTLVQNLIKFLRGGTIMLKHGRSGKPHRRLFWVSISEHQRKLLWMDPDSRGSTDCSTINLDQVSFIQLGCFSKVFKRHPVSPIDPSFYRSFTIGMKDGCRTVDVVADSMPDFEAWIVGLSNLVRVDPIWGGKLDISKKKNFEKLNCFEASLCESNHLYPTQYVMLKGRVLRIAEKTARVLQQCGNDAQKAHEILRGIHPPAINERGALYLTKGELRFFGRDEIDIVRITKIWMIFNQMNLVYDDNFTPATTFGVTERR